MEAIEIFIANVQLYLNLHNEVTEVDRRVLAMKFKLSDKDVQNLMDICDFRNPSEECKNELRKLIH